ncbi:MAG TPA: trypsin-like peptidase domain-containing protein [Methylomirabilota bacterium]|nr:trypsin-like peptidase domain-containing protein [Methylomirabilota bacterium]
MRHRAAAVASLSLVLLAPVAAGAQPATTPAASPPGPTYWTESASATIPADIQRLNDFMNQLAERMKPALVQVRVRRAVDPSDAPEQQPRSPGQPPSPPEEGRRASGSGFIIRQDGYLVTNAHVVDDAEQIQIKLSDGRRFAGRLVGLDARVDLALVKINATGLPVATLGDSNRLRVGEFVLALGHPFGLEQTVSFGIVSRKGAPLEVAAPGFDFIQTDAAVNPGNSGGPLVNMAGEVMGVNSMAARNGSIGFAIPVNLVKGLLPQLAEKGKVEWGWLGVTIAEIGEDEAPKYGLSEPRGVLIRNVVVGQPADKGGVKANDVIVGVDGASLEGPRDLQRIISATPVGRTVKLKVWREGKPTELDVVIGAYQGPGRMPVRRTPERTPAPPTEPAPPK